MTADWARLPYEVLATMSNRVIGEVDGVNRVAYDITSKPPAPSSGSSGQSPRLTYRGAGGRPGTMSPVRHRRSSPSPAPSVSWLRPVRNATPYRIATRNSSDRYPRSARVLEQPAEHGAEQVGAERGRRWST